MFFTLYIRLLMFHILTIEISIVLEHIANGCYNLFWSGDHHSRQYGDTSLDHEGQEVRIFFSHIFLLFPYSPQQHQNISGQKQYQEVSKNLEVESANLAASSLAHFSSVCSIPWIINSNHFQILAGFCIWKILLIKLPCTWGWC